jgi:hypothetical protein
MLIDTALLAKRSRVTGDLSSKHAAVDIRYHLAHVLSRMRKQRSQQN